MNYKFFHSLKIVIDFIHNKKFNYNKKLKVLIDLTFYTI